MALKYDFIVIGGGAAGLTAAKTARGFGKKVAIIEKNKLGGECTWTGCVPSKSIVKSAAVAYNTLKSEEFGLQTDNSINTEQLMAHVHNTIEKVYQTHTPEVLKKEGIEVIFGDPRFINKHSIQVNDKIIEFKKAIICTGSRPFVPPIEGLESVSYFTNENIFTIQQLPKSMIILGGGAIGAEMASALNRLGVSITIVEMADRILQKEDHELVDLLTNRFKKEGIILKTGMRAISVEQKEQIEVTIADKNNNRNVISAQTLLVAVGRKPNIEGLGLTKIGIKTTKKNIITNTKLQTSINNIYAAGDVVGPYLFSHMAWKQAVIATRNAFIPIFKAHINYNNVIWVTFTAPELASAGLTERAARAKYGNSIKIYKKPYNQLDRAMTDVEEFGLSKFICDKKGRLLGIHILGADAGDIIHETQLAKTRGTPFFDIASVIHAYPTYSELIWHASKKAYIDKLNNNIFISLLKKFFK